MSTTLPRVLQVAEEAVRVELEAALAELDADLCTVAAYHRGWVDRTGAPVDGRGGKCLRAALALLSGAQCCDEEAGRVAASAVELVHDFSLLHDDIMDGDELRRHRPTAWTVFGVDRAILAGDALLVLAHRRLLATHRPAAHAAAARLLSTAHDLIDGQARDMRLEGSPTASVESCVLMCTRKTGALLSTAAALGAELAGAPPSVTEPLAAFGSQLGLAFQAVDDLLGIWGDQEETGKPAAGDLARGKRSLPVVFAMAAVRRADGGSDPSAVAADAGLIERAGGRARTEEFALDRMHEALAALDTGSIDPAVRTELEELARFVVERNP